MQLSSLYNIYYTIIYTVFIIYIFVFFYMCVCVCPLEGNLLLFLKEVFYAAFIWLKYKTVIQFNNVK